MNRGRHHRSTAGRLGALGGRTSLSSARSGHGRTRSQGAKHAGTEDAGRRGLSRRIALFVCAFVLASGSAALAYNTTQVSGTGRAQAIALDTPGVGSTSKPTTTSLSLTWVASSQLPPGGGYLVLRSTSSGGPYAKVSSGTCQQSTTLVSTATSCTDTGLTAGTTYYYEVEAAYYNISALWVSAPDAEFSGATAPATPAGTMAPVTAGPAPAGSGTADQAPTITSPSSASLSGGSAGSFQVTASGTPAPTFSNTAFIGCAPSTLPSGITFSSQGLLSGTPGVDAVGTYTLCMIAANGALPDATQNLTLTIAAGTLVISSPAASGTTSSTPNLGPITVQRQTGSGVPITTGGALTVTLTSSPSSGSSFGPTQFASAQVTTVTIPSGQSSVTFWFGSTTTGTPTITVSAPGYVSATQSEITTAPVRVGPTLASGAPAAP